MENGNTPVEFRFDSAKEKRKYAFIAKKRRYKKISTLLGVALDQWETRHKMTDEEKALFEASEAALVSFPEDDAKVSGSVLQQRHSEENETVTEAGAR